MSLSCIYFSSDCKPTQIKHFFKKLILFPLSCSEDCMLGDYDVVLEVQ